MIRRILVFLLRHLPALLALLSVAVAAPFWVWVRQDTSVTLNVFFGWRQAVIVACAGVAFACLVVELLALKGGEAPADQPLRSARHAALAIVPFYAVMAWLGAAMVD